MQKKSEPDYNSDLFKGAIDFAEKIAGRYYLCYKHIFALEAIELEDLLQDARLATIELYKKWLEKPSKFNLKAGVSIGVGFNKLNKLKKAIMNRHFFSDLSEEMKKVAIKALSQLSHEDKDLIVSDFLKAHPLINPKSKTEVTTKLYDFEEEKELTYENIFKRLYGNGTVENKELDYNLLLEELRNATVKLRKDKIFNDIFILIIEKGLTFKKAGEKLKVSKQYINKCYSKLLKTIKQKIDVKQYRRK